KSPLLNEASLRPEGTGDDSERPVDGLPGTDVARATLVQMRSVESLIRAITEGAPKLVAGSKLLNDAKHRQDRIMDWLKSGSMQSTDQRFTDDEIELLAKDPPLYFFVLFEAMEEQYGLRLGTLGSVIVAEVIFEALMAREAVDPEGMPDMASLIKE